MSWFKEFLKNFGAPEENLRSNFTPRAQQVLALARKEADRFNHNYLGTEHILLGLIKLGKGVAFNVFERLGLDPEKVRQEVEKNIGADPDQKMIGNIPYTPRVKMVLDLARKEAKALHHTYIGTEHLLLGLLREGHGVAAKVLRNFNADLEQARIEVLKELDTNFVRNDESRVERFLPDDTSNFTPRAQQVLKLARREANRLHHNYLGTEHVLLGLIALGQGAAVNVLAKIGIDLENLRKEVERLAPAQTDENSAATTSFTPRVKEILVFAREEAKALHHVYIGTEHLLLGLFREVDGLAVTVLKNLGVDIERARIEVLKELDPNFTPGNVSLPPVKPNNPLVPVRQWLGRYEGEDFTPRAIEALTHAREEAEWLHLNYIGTEHLLLGLIKLGQGVANNMLARQGINLENVRAKCEALARGHDEKMFGKHPYTPRMNRVLKTARDEANAFNHTYIGTEHLFLGLLSEHEGPAAEIFKNFKVDMEQLRKDILNEIKPSGGDA